MIPAHPPVQSALLWWTWTFGFNDVVTGGRTQTHAIPRGVFDFQAFDIPPGCAEKLDGRIHENGGQVVT